MARKYNRTVYKVCAKGTKVVRSCYSANPMKKIEETGSTGKMVADIGNTILEKPVRKLSYALTSLSYNKETDNPCKGSVTYTAHYMGIKGVLKLIVSVIFGLPLAAWAIRFLNADFLTQIRLSLGMVMFIPIIWVIIRVKEFLSRIFTGKKRNKRK